MVPGHTPVLFSHGTMAQIETLDTVQAALLRIRCRGGKRFGVHRSCGWVADRWAELLKLPASDKLDLLREAAPLERLRAIDQTIGGPDSR